ncbi:MAG: hypothetical protein EZS28_034651 [Streblomastix strix]|uniref:Uncharacterized protein n=1 Tax=Streblomastix strix TaxID=222440 RepID=A0A5J4UIV7_9EUKA|nr:MAG: hypothetical protein EZS28_034651 [Streblomastix strix]
MPETETQFVTLKVNNEFEISTSNPWIIRKKEDGFIPKFSKNNRGVQKKTGAQIVYLTDSNDFRVVMLDNFVVYLKATLQSGNKVAKHLRLYARQLRFIDEGVIRQRFRQKTN